MKKTWSEWLYSQLIPVKKYRTVREDLLELLASDVFEYLESNPEYDLPSTEEFHELALTASATILEFPFPTPLRQVQILLNRIKHFITFVTIVLLVVAAYFSVQWMEQLTLQTLSIIDVITSLAFLPPGFMAVIVLYLYAIRSDRIFKKQLGQDLLISPGQVHASRRNTPRLFAFTIWNRSLNSSGVYVALGLLFIIRIISEDLYDWILRFMTENFDVFFSQKGRMISTVCVLYRRRQQEADTS